MASADSGGESLRTIGRDNLSRPPQESRSFAQGSSGTEDDVDLTTGTNYDAAAAVTELASSNDSAEWPHAASSYELVSRIGQGAFATVYLATCRTTGATCAIKVLDLENVDANFTDIRLEVQTMRLSLHPNILACYTNFVKETELWLVAQLMDRGSSLRCLQIARKKSRRRRLADGGSSSSSSGLPGRVLDLHLEDHITYILAESLKGLQYIHSNGQIHRDIKAGNILLDSQANVKIADFGVSGWLVHGGSRRENTRTFVGTPAWMSPELMEQVEGYDYKTDIWSIGITALELAKGYAPYAKLPPIKVLLLTIQEDPPSLETYDADDDGNNESGSDESSGTVSEEWSRSFQDIIRLCLQKDPKRRPSCDDLLSHDHFRHLLVEEKLAACRAQTKEKICDVVGDVGSSSGKPGAYGEGQDNQSKAASATVCVVSSCEEDRPAGTTWVFSDGSQVLLSKADDSMTEDEDKDSKNIPSCSFPLFF